jgi:hypothetical protein
MRTVAQLSAIFGALTALLAALLVLGTHVVVQETGARLRRYWLGSLAALLVGALGLGVLALLLNSFG